MPEEIFEKTCIGPCGKTLPLSDFAPRKDSKDGYRNKCRECSKAYLHDRKAERKEEQRLAIERGETKTCTGPCGRTLPLTSFGDQAAGKFGKNAECKFCQNVRNREAHRANPETRNSYYRKRRQGPNAEAIRNSENNWKRANREKCYKWSKTWRDNLRLEVITAYGGFCQCCGITDIFCLTLDHVDSDGAEHRKLIGASNSWTRLYQWAKDNGYPPNLRCLCLNCNRAAFYNGGTCPHQQEFSIVGMALSQQAAIAA